MVNILNISATQLIQQTVEALWYLRNLGYAWLCDKGQRL